MRWHITILQEKDRDGEITVPAWLLYLPPFSKRVEELPSLTQFAARCCATLVFGLFIHSEWLLNCPHSSVSQIRSDAACQREKAPRSSVVLMSLPPSGSREALLRVRHTISCKKMFARKLSVNSFCCEGQQQIWMWNRHCYLEEVPLIVHVFRSWLCSLHCSRFGLAAYLSTEIR